MDHRRGSGFLGFPVVAIAVACLALAGHSCDCGSGASSCTSDRDCNVAIGERCVDYVCTTRDGSGDSGRDGDVPGDGWVPEGGDGSGPGARMGPGTDNPFVPGPDNSDGVGVNDDGDLVLTGGGLTRLQYLWVANSGEGTVSKIDTFADPPREVGRFHTGLEERNADPSRTSVDLAGDVFVANRAVNYPDDTGRISSITKIAAETDRCIDRNGDGTIQTSTSSAPLPRSDGSGGVPAGQSADECVLWTRDFRPGSARPADASAALGCSGARAVAATAETGVDYSHNGNVWLGCYEDRRAYKLDGNTGDLLATVDISPCTPYGFLVDDAGILWACCRSMGGGPDRYIASYDPLTGAVRTLPAMPGDANPYGFAMGPDHAIWITTMGPTPASVLRYSETTGWQVMGEPSPGFFSSMRGAAVDEDGYAWVINTERPEVWLIDPARFPDPSSILEILPTSDDRGSRPTETGSGVAVDFNQNVWAISMGPGDENGWVTKYVVDRSSGRPVIDLASHPERIQMVGVGFDPYTYSDMIGYHLRTFTTHEGWYRQIFEACPGFSVRWNKIGWEASVPTGTRMVLRARTADDTARLSTAIWVTLAEVPGDASPVDIPVGVPPAGLGEGHFIQIEVRLYTGTEGISPTVHAIWFDWTCTEPIT